MINRIIELLKTALEHDDQRAKAIHDFEDLVNNSKQPIENEEVDNILSTLAYDLEYYVPSDFQHPSYFGDEKAKKLIRDALHALTEVYLSRNSESGSNIA